MNAGCLTKAARSIVLIVSFVIVYCGATYILTPQLSPTEEAGLRGAYSQASNTVQVQVLGTSTLLCGFSPVRLYNQYGICSFNNCSSSQSPISSYHLLVDAIKTQKESLSLVLVDATMLTRSMSESSSYVFDERVRKAMPLTLSKAALVMDLYAEYDDFDLFCNGLSLTSYHQRWNELKKQDFVKKSSVIDKYSRGQALMGWSFLPSNKTLGHAGWFNSNYTKLITAEFDTESKQVDNAINKGYSQYYKKIIDLCKSNDIDILLLKTPKYEWSDAQHDATAVFAKEMGVQFVDLNIPEEWDKTGLSWDDDFRDSTHLNILGSLKLTDYIGEYIDEHYNIRDITNDLRYAFMNDCVEPYAKAIEDARLAQEDDANEYIRMLNANRYTILLAANGNSVSNVLSLASDQWPELTALHDLQNNESYIAVLSGGECLLECSNSEGATIQNDFLLHDGAIGYDELKKGPAYIDPEASTVSMISCGQEPTDGSLVSIDSANQSRSFPGLNVVVIDDELGEVIDSCCIDESEIRRV